VFRKNKDWGEKKNKMKASSEETKLRVVGKNKA
jgi:hypothetical protein